MSDTGQVLIEISGGIAALRLVNPKHRNAISVGMWQTLKAFAGQAGERSDIRVVTVQGGGHGPFSAGADISDFAASRDCAGSAIRYDDLVEEACQAFEAIPQPSIALIREHCIGAGASLAASCDLLAAEEDAFFAVPAARLGLGYDSRGIERLVRVFGLPCVRSLLYSAERLPAGRLHAAGALHLLAPRPEFDQAAARLVATVAANAPLTLKAAKQALRALTVERDAGLLAQARELEAQANGSADYAEGRLAFAQRRPPRFQGR